MTTVTKTLKHELEDLKRMRDEIRVQAHLARADAKDAWVRLEKIWAEVEKQIRMVERESQTAGDQMSSALKKLLGELRSGYEKLRDS